LPAGLRVRRRRCSRHAHAQLDDHADPDDNGDLPRRPLLLSFSAGLLAAAPAERVSVCDQSGACAAVLDVSAAAVGGHRAHGDHVVSDEVCGNEVDDDCDGEVDEDCACPCYDADDLSRLHALWRSWQANEDLVYAYATCEERFTTIDYANGGSFDSDVVGLYFYGYSVDIAPDGTWVSFLTTTEHVEL
jgi:hypothetical protein